MNKTVFVDIDDTLVIYEGSGMHPHGIINGEPYEPNVNLIEKLKKFKGNIVIWSGGGKGYAGIVAKAVLPKDMKYTIRSKFEDFFLIKPGDIVIDDQKPFYGDVHRELGILVFGPFEDWNK